jgi:hypothetical protein
MRILVGNEKLVSIGKRVVSFVVLRIG